LRVDLAEEHVAEQSGARDARPAAALQPRERLRSCDDSQVPQLDVVGLIVADLGRAMAFYERLGLQFPENPDAEGHGHVEATLRGGLRFTLDTEESIRSFDPAWNPPSGGHRTTIAFLCDAPDDVDRLYEELVRAGAPSYKPPGTRFGASDMRK